MGSSDSLSCECGQVLFDVANRDVGETLTCPWCGREYRYMGGTKVERIKTKSKDKAAPPKESARKAAAPKESNSKIVLEGDNAVLTNFTKDETVKMKSFSRRKSSVRGENETEDGDAPAPKKKGPSFGDAPGGVFPMLGFMAGSTIMAFAVLGALFPENHQHKRSTPWGDPLTMKSPWPELIAMIGGQVLGFFGWGLYVYRLHKRTKAAAAEAAANPTPEKKIEKTAKSSSQKISVRKKSTTSSRETKRDRRKDDDDDEDDEHESER
jgi:hypothetical protein